MFSDTMMLGGGRKAAYLMENSLLFRGGQYFTRTPSVGGDRKTFTIDFWMRLNGDSPPQRTICAAYAGPTSYFSLAFDAAGHFYVSADSAGSISLGTTRVFHDVGWANFRVEVQISHGTASERVRFYYNGVRVPFDQPSPYNSFPQQTYDCLWNTVGVTHYLGVWPGNMSYNATGYMAEFIAVDGAGSLSHGETDPVTGSWRPKKISGVTWGTNGCSLGAPWDVVDLGKDYSGSSTLSVLDSSTKGSLVALSNGGLTVSTTASNGQGAKMRAFGTQRVYAGMRVFEFKVEHANAGVGVAVYSGVVDTIASTHCLRFGGSIEVYPGSSGTNSLAELAVNDVIRVEFNASIGVCAFYKNGTLEYTVTGLPVGLAWRPFYGPWASGASSQGTFRFDPATFTSGTPSAGYSSWSSGNDWTPSGFVASDVVTDTPTNVYATLNPLDNFSAVISEGGLKVTSGSSTYNGARCTFAVPSTGKWYWEVPVINHSGAVTEWISLGITKQGIPLNSWAGTNAGSVCYGDRNDGSTGIFVHGAVVLQSTSLAFVTGNVIQVAYNADTGQLWFGKNNLWWNAGATSLTGNPASGQSPTAIVSPGEYFPYIQMAGTSNAVTVNFGQRSFAYTPPAGFKSLCTANLPATTGQASGSFTGNASADGPCVYTGAVPVTLTINNNAVTWGTHADKLETGFKIRTASASYNASGTNNWAATYNKQPTVGSNHTPANAQIN